VTDGRRTPRGLLLAIFVTALAVRAVVGVWAQGRGEMEGLAYRYEQDAYALTAGYGFVRPVEGQPPQVDLLAFEDSLEARGERLDPSDVPAPDPARWRPSTLHPPGYASYLALVYRVFGNPLIPWAKALQAVIDALACLVVFTIGRRLAGPRTGVVAAALCALFLPTAYLVTSRVADALMPAFLVGTFYLFVRGLESGRLRWYVATGVALGAACMFRPDSLLFPSFLFLGAAALRGFRHALVAATVITLVTAAMVVPWGIRNRVANGSFNVTTHAGGMALYQGLGQFPNRHGIVFDDDIMEARVIAEGFESIDDPGADRWFKQQFLRIVREDPLLVPGQMLRRIPIGLAPLYRWGYDNPHYRGHGFYDYARRGLSPLAALRAHPLDVALAYWDRVVFALVGLLLFAVNVALLFDPRTRRVGVLLFMPYLYVYLSHLPIALGARLLLPAVFAQLLAVAVFLEARRRAEPLEPAFR
jgi:4-amino-4-deoxy-L-arabinose transferase-like glycosyltransferase